jgi:hypothetical protein
MFENPTLLMQHISFSLQIDLLEKLPTMYTRAEREREKERERERERERFREIDPGWGQEV